MMQGKLLKGIGLALIAFPEPFTTPIGLGLIAASVMISRSQEKKKRAYVRHLLTEYLHTYRPFGFGMNYVPKTSADLPYRQRAPQFNVNTNLATECSPRKINPVRFASLQPREETKSVVHTLNPRAVAKRYVETGGTRAGFVGYWGRQAKFDFPKIVHNTLNLCPAALS
jgi:hypothetical protein